MAWNRGRVMGQRPGRSCFPFANAWLRRNCGGTHGFTRKELVATTAAIAILLLVLVPASERWKRNDYRILCAGNLHQISLAFKTWGPDQQYNYAPRVPDSQSGSLDAVATGAVFRHFQVMSNEVGEIKDLICPADTRAPAKNFQTLSNFNLSYFVGVDASDSEPQMFLSGDRNITNGLPLTNRILVLRPDKPAGWTAELHNGQGNVLIADGSVEQWSTAALGKASIQTNGYTPERLAIP